MVIKLCTVLLCISLDSIKRCWNNMVKRLCTLSEAREWAKCLNVLSKVYKCERGEAANTGSHEVTRVSSKLHLTATFQLNLNTYITLRVELNLTFYFGNSTVSSLSPIVVYIFFSLLGKTVGVYNTVVCFVT